MKKKLLSTLLMSVAVATFATTANASTEVVDNKKNDTDLTFSLSDGGHNVNPGVYKGKLVLVYTPAKYDLGTKPVGKAQAMVSTSTTKRYVGIIDDRDTRDGWTLTAQLDNFTNAAGGTLDTTLSFGLDPVSGFAYTDNATKSDYVMPANPELLSAGVYQQSNVATPTVAKTDFTVTEGIALTAGSAEPTKVLTSKAGIDKSTVAAEVQNISAAIAATDQQDVGTYGAKLHWTLTNGL